MNKQEKIVELEKLKGIFAENPLVLLCHQKGLTVEGSNDLRRKCRESNAYFKVSKNSLLRMAISDTSYQGLSDKINGPITITWSTDPLAAAKVITDFSKENEGLTVVVGANAQGILNAEELAVLAATPPLDDLRAKIVGLLSAPASGLARIIPAVAGKVARAIAQKPENIKGSTE